MSTGERVVTRPVDVGHIRLRNESYANFDTVTMIRDDVMEAAAS